jgi:hypothetical protein
VWGVGGGGTRVLASREEGKGGGREKGGREGGREGGNG